MTSIIDIACFGALQRKFYDLQLLHGSFKMRNVVRVRQEGNIKMTKFSEATIPAMRMITKPQIMTMSESSLSKLLFLSVSMHIVNMLFTTIHMAIYLPKFLRDK